MKPKCWNGLLGLILVCLVVGATAATPAAAPLAPVAPSNDNSSNPTVIGSTPYSNSVDASQATTQATDPTPSCVVSDPNVGDRLHTVWYRFTAPSAGTMEVDTIGSGYDTILSAYIGTAGSFSAVGGASPTCNDDITPGLNLQSQIYFATTPGVTYSFMVSSYGLSAGTLSFHADFIPTTNDNFSDATVINSGTFTATGANYSATMENADPYPQGPPVGAPCGDGDRLNTLWFSFKPSVNGTIQADTIGSSFDTILSVYTGSQGSFTQVACNDDVSEVVRQSQLTFSGTANTVYYFMISAYGGALGTLTFHLNGPPSATDLRMTKTVSPSTLIRGGTGSFTLTVTNNGQAATDGTTVTVTDSLPAGLTPTSAAGTGWTCTISGQNVSCTQAAALSGGSSYSAITIAAAVAANAGASLTNTASVIGGGDNTAATGSATVTVTGIARTVRRGQITSQ